MREVKRPKKIQLFDMSGELTAKVPVVKLLCGGMHTLALAASGAVFSWGCNDEGALGRKGTEDKPMLVPLPIRATDISAGDSHSVFYSTLENKAFFTGLYRVSHDTSPAPIRCMRDSYQAFLEFDDWTHL